jgi:hypothetical protein
MLVFREVILFFLLLSDAMHVGGANRRQCSA